MISCSAVVVLVALAQVQSSDIVVDANYYDQFEASERKQITQVDLNDIFDKALPTIQKAIIKGGLDPLSLPDQMLSVTTIPGLNPQVQLQRGWVQEASTIRREGDVIVRYSDRVIEFDAVLGWAHLDVTYGYTLRYLFFSRKGDFNARFDDVKIGVLGSFDLNTRKIKLRFFKIIEIGQLSLKIHGHILDHVLNGLTKVFTIFCRKLVIREIEYRFELGLQEKIKEINDLIPEPYTLMHLELPWDNHQTELAYLQYQVMSNYFKLLAM